MSSNEIIISFVINLVSGLICSFIFIFLLLKYYRPNLTISSYICHRTEMFPEGEKPRFSFKIVNSSIYHAFDVNIQLFLMQPVNHTGANTNLLTKSLPLRTSNVSSIERFRKKHHKKDPFALYAYVFHTNEPLDQYLAEPNTYVEVRLIARHGLTGLSDVFIQRFGNADIIKFSHKFAFGKSLETVPLNLTI